MKNQKYEEHLKIGSIYVFSTDKKDIYKCGRTKNIQKRKSGLQTNCVEDLELLYEYKTSNDVLLESIIHDILKNYRSNSNREHFWCNLDYIKMIIHIAGPVLDTLKSSFQYISKDELLEKIYEKMKELSELKKSNDLLNEIKEESMEQSPVIEPFKGEETNELYDIKLTEIVNNKNKYKDKYKDKYKEYYKRYKERKKEYYNENKDKIQEKQKERYKERKNNILIETTFVKQKLLRETKLPETKIT